MADELDDFLKRGRAAQQAVDALTTPAYKHEQCAHVRRGELPAITRVRHDTISGAPTRAERLATETELCAMCSGMIVGMLTQLERSGLLP
jgi:hypothetical protein